MASGSCARRLESPLALYRTSAKQRLTMRNVTLRWRHAPFGAAQSPPPAPTAAREKGAPLPLSSQTATEPQTPHQIGATPPQPNV